VHPVVAEALARRAADPAGIHHGGTVRGEGELGWPAEPAPGGGDLGWPGDVASTRPVAVVAAEAQPPSESDDAADDPAPSADPAGRRRGWRRLLGARAA
jgi:hypothetical protein